MTSYRRRYWAEKREAKEKADKAQEARLRRLARQKGLQLQKSRTRHRGDDDYGRFRLIDPKRAPFEGEGYHTECRMTLDDVEAKLATQPCAQGPHAPVGRLQRHSTQHHHRKGYRMATMKEGSQLMVRQEQLQQLLDEKHEAASALQAKLEAADPDMAERKDQLQQLLCQVENDINVLQDKLNEVQFDLDELTVGEVA